MKILARPHNDRLWIWRFALSPEHQARIYLNLLRDHRLEREYCGRIYGIIGVHCHVFHLGTGAIANFKRRRNFTLVSRRQLVLLSLRSGATARGADRFNAHRLVASVLILEMADRLFVAGRRM